MNKILWVVVVLVLMGASFGGGMWYQQMKDAQQALPPPGTAYSSSVIGTVAGQGAGTITLTLPDGTTKTYALSTSTQVLATVTAGQQAPTLAGLANGMVVSLALSTEADGSVTVQSISVAP